jgi:hypothetical protein
MDTLALLDEKRMSAEVVILNDGFGSQTKETIINQESANADLIIVGLTPKTNAYTRQYIEVVSNISELPASLLILSPSEEFEEINLVDSLLRPVPQAIAAETEAFVLPEIQHAVLSNRMQSLAQDLDAICKLFLDTTINSSAGLMKVMVSQMHEFLIQNIATLEREIENGNSYETLKIVVRNHQSFLRSSSLLTQKQNNDIIVEAKKVLIAGLAQFGARIGNLLYELPEYIVIPFKISAPDLEKNMKFSYQNLVSYHLHTELTPRAFERLNEFEMVSFDTFGALRKVIFGLNDQYEKLRYNFTVDGRIDLTPAKELIAELVEMEQGISNYQQLSHQTIKNAQQLVLKALLVHAESADTIRKSEKLCKQKTKPLAEYIDGYADTWGDACSMINNSLQLDSLVLSEQKICMNIVQKSNLHIKNLIQEAIFSPVDKLLATIDKTTRLELGGIVHVSFNENLQLSQIATELFAKISGIIDELPSDLKLPDRIYQNDQPVIFTEIDGSTNNVRKVANYYFDTLFYDQYYREIEVLNRFINKSVIEFREAQSILLFRVNNLKSEAETSEIEALASVEFFKKLAARVQAEKTKIEKELIRNETVAITQLQHSFSKLFYHTIRTAEKKISARQREQKSKRFSARISNFGKSIKAKTNSLLVDALNTSSKGIILSQTYLDERQNKRVHTSQILDFVDKITPDNKVYSHVPFFYRTLLSSKSKINDDLWVARTKETAALKTALQRHKEGKGGAILIRGIHGAGKTALTRYLSAKLLKKSPSYWLNAPAEGSTDLHAFLSELQRVTGISGSINDIFQSLPTDSVIIFNDLELWWERSQHGSKVILQILELIYLYSNRFVFVANCNTHAYTIMDSLESLSDYFVANIECTHFTTNELNKLVLSRHRSSGMLLKYKNKTEDELTDLSFSILFNTYFGLSNGIPGIALNTWKANIVAADENSISIKKPIAQSAEMLKNLDPDWYILVSIFVQHKRITGPKLARIMGIEQLQADLHLRNLQNAGIILPKAESYFELGRNIEPYLVNICIEKGIL